MIASKLESIENDRALLSVDIDPRSHLKHNVTTMRVDAPEDTLITATVKNHTASSVSQRRLS